MEWSSASLLRTAASALQDVLVEQQKDATADPLMIIVARKIGESLIAFSEAEGFQVRHIEDESVIDDILAQDDLESLLMMAKIHLKLESVGPPVIDDLPAPGIISKS